jgi:CRISPR system Cascade subunit CasB
MSPSSSHAREFASYLASLVPDERDARKRGDRAILAALRRGLGKSPDEEFAPYHYIGRFLDNCTRDQENAHYLVASLFAIHQLSWPDAPQDRRPSNLGSSFRILADRVEAEHGDRASVERRFVALLNCHADDLPQHLRHAVSLLRSQSVPIDWAVLLDDVQHWGRWDSAVRRRWARAFWGETATAARPGDGGNSDSTEHGARASSAS